MIQVLIVEDDPMVAAINKQYIHQNENFHVVAICGDGLKGLEFLRKHTVDLVIMDVYMPRMDGLELLQKIREEKIQTSVIMVTAANNANAVSQALSLGVVDYLVKPFSAERFNQALENFKNRKSALDQSNEFDQRKLDAMLNGDYRDDGYEYPKGIQAQTMDRIIAYIKSQFGKPLTSEEISDEIGLSRVTVRRYMNYLSEKNIITAKMNYETGGRPCMLYRYNGK